MFRSVKPSNQISSVVNSIARRTFAAEAAAIDPEKWKDPGFQRKFLDGVQKELKFNSYEGWYQVKPEELIKRGGEPLMKIHGNSYIKTIMSVYNEIPFQSAKFYNNMPLDFWRNIDNVRQFFDNVASKLGTSGMWENWYQTSTETIENFGGKGLLEVYKGMVNALLQAYPEHPWKIWKFNNLPKDYWIEKKRQREFMDDMVKAYGYKNFEEYYKLTSMHLIKHGGRGLLHLYNDKVHDVVMAVYPEHDWKIWRFMRVFDDWWDKLPNQRFFMRDLQKKLNFNSMEDWYKLKSKDITEYGGKRLLYMHNNSLAKVLQVIYPDYAWQIYRFTRVPKNHWDKDEDLEKLFKEAAPKMGISQHEEWIKVTEEDLESVNIPGSGPLIYKYGGIINMAEAVNNKVQWRELELRNESDMVKTHRNVARYVKKLFPTVTEVQMNYAPPELKLPLSGMQLTYGVWVPQLKVVFHWQGERLNFFAGKKTFRQEVAEKLGIRLVYVSTSWDKSIEQLEDYIKEQHPDMTIEKSTGDRMARKKALRKMMEGDEQKNQAAQPKPQTPKVEEKEEERPLPAWLANYLKQQQEEKEKKEREEKLKEEKAKETAAKQESSS